MTPLLRSLSIALLALTLAAPARAQSAAIQVNPFGDSSSENSYQHLGERFADKLRDMDWGDGVVSILVQDADFPLTAFAQNENRPMAPGGVLQIVTAAAALSNLGQEHHFTTRLGIGGPIEDHELKGSVVIRGDGDPTLSAIQLKDPEDAYELFDKWYKLLRKQGIKRISGAIIGDDRAFDEQWQGPGWPLEKLGSPDLPSVSALNFNHNCVDIFWQKSKKPGKDAICEVFPDLPKYVFFANKVLVAADAPRGREYLRDRDSNVISITGALPLRTEIHERASIEDPARFFAEAFKARLIERGIEVKGPAQAGNKTSPAEIPNALKELDAHASPALLQILSDMMHYDLTLNAEVAFKAMGLKQSGKIGSFGTGQDAMREFIDSLHLTGSIWSFADGSGKSSMDRISPAQLLSVMRAVRKKGLGRDLDFILPRAWDAGTMQDRFRPLEDFMVDENGKKVEKAEKKHKETLEAPPIWAKSGSGDGLETLAGYAQTRFGRKLAFAFMVNGSRVPAGVLKEQLDSLALALTQE